jgi:transposase InsO family protein
MTQEDGERIGRFKMRGLMRELKLISKQPDSHAYKKAIIEAPSIPNVLNREFDVPTPNQLWCGDTTYVRTQGRLHDLAVILDLYARRIVGWALSEKPDASLVIKVLGGVVSHFVTARAAKANCGQKKPLQSSGFLVHRNQAALAASATGSCLSNSFSRPAILINSACICLVAMRIIISLLIG